MNSSDGPRILFWGIYSLGFEVKDPTSMQRGRSVEVEVVYVTY